MDVGGRSLRTNKIKELSTISVIYFTRTSGLFSLQDVVFDFKIVYNFSNI